MACGGTVSGDQDAGPDAAFDGGPVDDAGYTRCGTPEGYGICGSATGCDAGAGRPGCQFCMSDEAGAGICDGTFTTVGSRTCSQGCDDGSICYEVLGMKTLFCLPYSVGALLGPYVSDKDHLRYADFGLWSGAALPKPGTCPSFGEFQICGGSCGGCAVGEVCTGRSPLHPYGFCKGEYPCGSDAGGGNGWFRYSVEPAAQLIANQHQFCLPLAMCQALAAKLPWGGTCTPQ